MNTIFAAQVLNPYRAKGKRYSIIRGHTGVDLGFASGDKLFSPVTGQVVAITNQQEMGICLYIVDAQKNCHVFSHLMSVSVKLHESVKRDQEIARTDNTGTATSGPHLHYEVITTLPVNFIDKIMYRKELSGIFQGYNTDPIPYLKNMYGRYGIDWKTGLSKEVEHNPHGF